MPTSASPVSPSRGLKPQVVMMGALSALFPVFVGILINRNRKFVIASDPTCRHGYIDITAIGSSLICCDARHKAARKGIHEMCQLVGSFGGFEKAMVSYLAWILPFLPLVVNILINLPRLGRDSAFAKRLVLRGFLYLTTIVWRTIVLYLGVNYLEKILQGPEPSLCWYLDKMPKHQCKDRFNVGDHVILMMVHYIAIPLFETNITRSDGSPEWMVSVVNTAAKMLTILAGINIFISGTYFHTRLETFVAFLLAYGTVFLPYTALMSRLSTSEAQEPVSTAPPTTEEATNKKDQ